MIPNSGFRMAGLLMMFVCSVAGAQTRVGAPTGRVPFVRARATARASAPLQRTSAARVQHAGVMQISPSTRIVSGFTPFDNSFDFGSNLGVPGLGFDYPHLAAISGASQGSSFGMGHHEHHGQGSFVPFLYGGYPYFYSDLDYEQPQPSQAPVQPQPVVIVIQQPTPTQSGAGSGNDEVNDSAPSQALDATAPVRDVGEFILVRRDGPILFASMFMVEGTQMMYVTPEGIRRTLAMADLDIGATQEMNEARGTTVQLHN